MRYFLILLFSIMFLGCSNTAQGVKQDTKNAVGWSKEKVNQGATYVKEKTE